MTDITTDPEDRLAAVGTNVTLTCDATGADSLMYHWMRMGNKNIGLQATGVSTRTLVINNVTVADSGMYRCTVSSGDVTVTSKCGALSVVGKLYINNY